MAALPQLTLLRPINTTVHVVHHQQQPAGTHEHVDDDDACCCRTPTSPESQLPSEAKVCPPAPRKPRRAPLRPRRRRQLDLELVEECSDLPELITVSAEELEATLTLTRKRRPGAHSCCSSATKLGSRCRKRKRR